MSEQVQSSIESLPLECPQCGCLDLVTVGCDVDDESGYERDKWECEDCGFRFWGSWYQP